MKNEQQKKPAKYPMRAWRIINLDDDTPTLVVQEVWVLIPPKPEKNVGIFIAIKRGESWDTASREWVPMGQLASTRMKAMLKIEEILTALESRPPQPVPAPLTALESRPPLSNSGNAGAAPQGMTGSSAANTFAGVPSPQGTGINDHAPAAASPANATRTATTP